MRIAFYAPLKSPTHGTPSGDRRVAGLLMDALAAAGHRVQVASTFRSYDGDGDEARQRALRAELAKEQQLDPQASWIAVVAMMRAGDKLSSYRVLAKAMERLDDLPWQLLVAGDGAARAEVERMFDRRACFLGALRHRRVAELLAASDVFAWPAVNEAYGMALLEAQAAGVPVVSCNTRGVPDVVLDGPTRILVRYGDEGAFAEALRELLTDSARRRALGTEAARYVAAERSLERASARLGAALAAL